MPINTWNCKFNVPVYTSWTKQSLVTGLSRTLVLVCSLTERTKLFASRKTSSTLPRGQEPRGAGESVKTTTSPTVKLCFLWFHFCLSCNSGKYSWIHRFQNKYEMYRTCLQQRFTYMSEDLKAGFPFKRRRWFGVRGSRSFGSSDNLVIGQSLRMASTSHITVWSPSSSSLCWCKTEFNTRFTECIICSQAPPWRDPAGGFNLHSTPSEIKAPWMRSWFNSARVFQFSLCSNEISSIVWPYIDHLPSPADKTLYCIDAGICF